MDKYVIGTIVGTALLSIFKNKSGGKSEEFDPYYIADTLVEFSDVYDDEMIRDMIEQKYPTFQAEKVYKAFKEKKEKRQQLQDRLDLDRETIEDALDGKLPYLGDGRNRTAYITAQGQVVKIPKSMRIEDVNEYIEGGNSMDWMHNAFPRKPHDLDIGFPTRTYTNTKNFSRDHNDRVDFQQKVPGETIVGARKLLKERNSPIFVEKAKEQMKTILENQHLLFKPFQQAARMASYKYAVDGNRGNFILQPNGEIKIIDANLNLSGHENRPPEELMLFNMGQVWEAIFYEPSYMEVEFDAEMVEEFKALALSIIHQYGLENETSRYMDRFNKWTGKPKGSATRLIFKHRITCYVKIRNFKMIQLLTNNSLHSEKEIKHQTGVAGYHHTTYRGVQFNNSNDKNVESLIVWFKASYPHNDVWFDITFYSFSPKIEVAEGDHGMAPKIWEMIRRSIPSIWDGSNKMTSWWQGLSTHRPKVAAAFWDGPLPSLHSYPDRGRGVQTVSKESKRRKQEYGDYYMELDTNRTSFSNNTFEWSTCYYGTSTGIPMALKNDGTIVPANALSSRPKLRKR